MISSFPHQIQSEYYGGNRSVSIEGIVLFHFSALQQPVTFLYSGDFPWHAGFDSFLMKKQDDATTAAHSKLIIELLQKRQLILRI